MTGTHGSTVQEDDPTLTHFLKQFAENIAPKANAASVESFIHEVGKVDNPEKLLVLVRNLTFDLRDDAMDKGLSPEPNPGKRPKVFFVNATRAMKRRLFHKEWRSDIKKLEGALRCVGEGRLNNGRLHEAFGLLAGGLTQVWTAMEEKRAAEEAIQVAEEAIQVAIQAASREMVSRMRGSSNGSISSSIDDDQGNANVVTIDNVGVLEDASNLVMESWSESNSHDGSRQD